MTLPKGGVISVIGAGGKTTCIRRLAETCRRLGYRVLVTTTTHMLDEEGRKTGRDEILAELRRGYVFAGTPVVRKGVRKITMLPEEVLSEAIGEADITLAEADGAACLPFKVPKMTEPVICPKTTQILLIAGMRAVGQKLCDACYNYQEAVRAFGMAPDAILTPENMAEIYRGTYLRRLPEEAPGIPVRVISGQDDEEEMREYGRRFEALMNAN